MMKFYTVKEFAKAKNVEENTVYTWVKQKKLYEVDIAHKTPKLVFEKNKNQNAVIIAMNNLKGGCGKTTISAHLAIYLSKLGFKTLLIDTDHQNQCEMFFPEQTYHNTFKDLLNGKAGLQDCIYEVKTKNSFLDMIFSDYGLALFTRNFSDEDKLTNLLAPIRKNYDFIIIDTAPDFDIININVVKAATHIIIPLIPSPLHVKGMDHNFQALRDVADILPEQILGVVLSIVDVKTAQHRAYTELLHDKYNSLLYESIIPKDLYLPKVNDFGTNIFDYREKSKSSQALKRFTWETLRRL